MKVGEYSTLTNFQIQNDHGDHVDVFVQKYKKLLECPVLCEVHFQENGVRLPELNQIKVTRSNKNIFV